MTIENGRQAERTTMAWQRTALGLGGVSALIVRDSRGDLVTPFLGGVGLLAALALLVHADAHHRRHDDADPEHTPMGIGAVRALAGMAVLLALVAVLVVLRTPG